MAWRNNVVQKCKDEEHEGMEVHVVLLKGNVATPKKIQNVGNWARVEAQLRVRDRGLMTILGLSVESASDPGRIETPLLDGPRVKLWGHPCVRTIKALM